MKKINLKLFLGILALIGIFATSIFSAEGPDKTKRNNDSFKKGLGTPTYQILNINNLWTWMRADGQSNHSPTGDDGAYYPRGTKWVIYQDGFVWGGKAYLDAGFTQPAPVHAEPIRVGGQTYNIGTRAGRIIGSGASAVAANPADPDVRIFRVRRDYASMSETELKRDASESFEKLLSEVSAADVQKIIDQYKKDWDEWPVTYGAPYIERNGTAGYQKPPAFSATFTVDSLIARNYDEPGLAGADPNSPADQVIWTVMNDLDITSSTGLFGSHPLGLEAQITCWGYKRADAMGNLYFKKIKFINKGGVVRNTATNEIGSFHIDSMFIAQWSDPDLGAFGDDLCGTDSVLSLGFVYNGGGIDAEFKKFNLPPPAVGYDFLQGPLVTGLASDSGVFNLQRVYGKKNLPLTSFAYFSAGSGISDPPFSREGGLRWWRMLQGFVPDPSTSPWKLYTHPPGVAETKFPLSGDPTKRIGFIDGLGLAYSLAPGDRRIVLNSGPFKLSPGETQEIVVGTVAGLGSDRLSSVSVMKFNDRFVQNTYNALFQVPKPPIQPAVTVSELDGQIVLEWGSNFTRVSDTETKINHPGAYKFEGYNVYQLPRSSSDLSEGVRIATYDLPTDPTVVLDEQFDQKSGQILLLPVQYGSNSGIVRHFSLNRDYVLDIDRLNNGQEYYLAVTAYSIATTPGYLPSFLESDPVRITARPQSPVGVRYTRKYNDIIGYRSTGAFTDGSITPKLVDPKATTGVDYEVTFDTVPASGGVKFQWKLKNLAEPTKIYGPFRNLGEAVGGDIYNHPIVDGIFWEMAGPPNEVRNTRRTGMLRDSMVYHTGGRITLTGGTGPFWVGEGGDIIFGGIRNSKAKVADMRNVYIVFDTTSPKSERLAYRYLRNGQAAKADARFANPPYGRAFYSTSSWGYCDTIVVPFKVFKYDPKAGITTPVQLAMGMSENNVADGWVDGRFGPLNRVFLTSSDGGREFIFVFSQNYDPTMSQAEYKFRILGDEGPNAAFGYHDAMYVLWMRNNMTGWSRANLTAGQAVPDGWAQRDTIFIDANHILNQNVKFLITSPDIQKSIDLLKSDVEKVGVYPNPYYAYNPAETNRFVRFVTFNKLPPSKVTVKIFNLAGHLVKTINKEDNSQFLRWDLNNQDNFPVASGMYIAHVDMPDLGMVQILKIAIIQEQEVPDVF